MFEIFLCEKKMCFCLFMDVLSFYLQWFWVSQGLSAEGECQSLILQVQKLPVPSRCCQVPEVFSCLFHLSAYPLCSSLQQITLQAYFLAQFGGGRDLLAGDQDWVIIISPWLLHNTLLPIVSVPFVLEYIGSHFYICTSLHWM